MAAILFALSICLVLCPFASAQCYSYDGEAACLSEYRNNGCWWIYQSGSDQCTGVWDSADNACTYYYDESACNDDSNNACEYDGSYCQQSSCMTAYYEESSCSGQSDYVGSCAWDSNNYVCVRGGGGGGGDSGSGSTAEPTCASYSSADCTPDKLQGTCIVSNWDGNQAYHNMAKCQILDDLCQGMGGSDEANCGGSYNAISMYDFMPWCYYDETAGSCVASNFHQKTDESACNSACK